MEILWFILNNPSRPRYLQLLFLSSVFLFKTYQTYQPAKDNEWNKDKNCLQMQLQLDQPHLHVQTIDAKVIDSLMFISYDYMPSTQSVYFKRLQLNSPW